MKAPDTANIFLALLVTTVCSVPVGACATGTFSSRDIQASARALAIQPDGKLVVAGAAGTGNRLAFALARYLPDGSLDPAFGTAGKVTTHFKGSPASANFLAGAYARGIVIQPDGRTVAAGVASIGGFTSVRFDYAMARYRADGSLDPTFGAEGTVLTQIEQSIYNVPTLTLQPDGKPIVAGEALVGGKSVFALIRYLTDGSLDRTFGTGGKVTTEFIAGRSSSFVRAVAVQPDGKLVAAGFTVVGGRDHFALARYLPDGSPDATFGFDGTVTAVVAFGAKGPITPGFVLRGAFALALQPDGKLIGAGATEALNGQVVFALARFLPDGSLDRSFGTDGTVATDFGDGSVAFALALQPDGNVVAAGATGRGDVALGKFALARYHPNGSLDRSFGTDGKVISDFGWGGAQALGLQPDGKLVAVGSAEIGDRRAFALARYLSDGSMDPTFGLRGTATTDFGGALSP